MSAIVSAIVSGTALLQRQLNLLDYALAGLYRRRWKSIGILLIFAMVIFLFASFQLLTRGLSEAARQILEDAPDITVQQMSAGRQVALDPAMAGRLRSIFGISRISPRIWGYYFDERNGANYTVVGLDPLGLKDDFPLLYAKGRQPPGDMHGEVYISSAVGESMGLGSRRGFSLFRPDLSMASFTVRGVFDQTTSLATADMMLMSLTDARDLFSIPEPYITDLMVYVANPREIDTIAAKIAESIPGSRVITTTQIAKTYSAVFSWRSGFGGICLLISLIAFVILAYDKASGLSREDLREVGILKIIGWQAGDVMAIRFWESGIVSMLAFASGYALAWVHVVWWHGLLFRPLLLGWSVLRPELHLVPPFHAGDLLMIFTLSVLPYLCATVVPAWRSSVVRPDTVL